MRRAVLLLALAACGGRSYDTRFPTPSEDLKVTRAVLYQNGIGYFERRGRVQGNRVVLRIRPDQIADFLKSLTIVDLAKDGRAISVALPTEKTQARQMADLPPQVREQGGLLAIAAAFRGARAHVQGEEGAATGRIVGVEQVQTSKDENAWRLTILDDETLRTFDVAKIRSLQILDKTLTVGLDKALDVQLNEGAWKPIELTVALAGTAPHDVVVSYVVEMPTWKPAYRVVVEDGGKALVQGWAVVDNVSGEDWNDVQLSLTAGTPLAFSYDLYTPHYVRRPNLSPPQEEQGVALSREAYLGAGGGYEAGEDAAPAAVAEETAPPPPPAPGVASGGARHANKKASAAGPSNRPVNEQDLERNYRTLVAGAGVGSLFRYDITEPVSVRDRESALVSVVSTKVPGEDVMLFRVGIDASNPYRAVRLKNETGFVLEHGPVSIYRTSTFLGEALVPRIEKGSTSFVPYAIDGRVRVFLEQDQREEGMRLVTIVNGHLTAESKMVTRFKYEVENRSGEKATLYVQRPRRTGWTITKVALDADQKTAPPQPGKDGVLGDESQYSVPIALPESGRVKIVVEEETPSRRDVEILSAQGREILQAYLAGADADPEVSRQLKAAVDLSDKLAAADRRLRDLEQQRRLLGEREQQIRDNLNLLHKTAANADLRKQLETKLAEMEKQLDDVTREIVKLSEDRTKMTNDLATLLKGVTLNRK